MGRLGIVIFVAIGLSGCVSTAVSVTRGAVGVAADVTGAAVGVATDAADVVTPW